MLLSPRPILSRVLDYLQSPPAKVELFAQSFDLRYQVHNKLGAHQIEAISGPQMLNAAQNTNSLVIKIPATACGIHHRRHKSVFAINDNEAAGYLGQARHHVECVHGACVGVRRVAARL